MPRISIDYLAQKLRFKPEVLARIRRLNPIGVPEGSRIRGYVPAARSPGSWTTIDAMSPRAFVANYGRDAYDAIPRNALIRHGHRKGIAREYIEDNF